MAKRLIPSGLTARTSAFASSICSATLAARSRRAVAASQQCLTSARNSCGPKENHRSTRPRTRRFDRLFRSEYSSKTWPPQPQTAPANTLTNARSLYHQGVSPYSHHFLPSSLLSELHRARTGRSDLILGDDIAPVVTLVSNPNPRAVQASDSASAAGTATLA